MQRIVYIALRASRICQNGTRLQIWQNPLDHRHNLQNRRAEVDDLRASDYGREIG